MFSLDLALRRFFRAVRNALPGATTASRLAGQEGHWRQQPPAQRASAYAQFLHTQQQLQQHHLQQKVFPKFVSLLFDVLKSHLAAPLGQILLIYLLSVLFGAW